MKKMLLHCRATVSVLMLCLLAILSGCAEIRLNTLPSPPPTAKLRVVVLPMTTGHHPLGAWRVSEKDFAEYQYRSVSRMLQIKGIYSVVPREEVLAVTANREIEGWQWARQDWKLAKEAGRALHADYVLIYERTYAGSIVNKLVLISLSTGRVFEETMLMPEASGSHLAAMGNPVEIVRTAYREIFMAAKGDMFSTAIRKGRAISPPTERKAPERSTFDATKKRPHPAAGPIERMKPPESETPKTPPFASPPAAAVKAKDARAGEPGKDKLTAGLQATIDRQQVDTAGRRRLVVYDFDAVGQLDVAAMILTEALREELHELGRFLLVNRENIVQVMDELKLQQSGMVDEAQAVQMGKWLAANETVTGKLAQLGNLYVLQAKRTDVKTLGTLGIGSLKSSAGREEELLNGLPSLARKLAGLP